MSSLNYPLLVVLVFALEWISFYSLRILGSQHRRLVLRDYYYIYMASFIIALVIITNILWLKILLLLYLFILFFLQWANIISFRFYGIKINFHMIKTFSTGIGHFGGESMEALPIVIKEVKLAVLFVLMLICYISLCFFSVTVYMYSFVALFVLFVAIVTKSKINRKTIWLWVILLIVFQGIAFSLRPIILSGLGSFYVKTGLYLELLIPCVLISFIGILLIVFFQMSLRSKKAFMVLPSLLQQQFREEKVPLTVLKQPPSLKPQDLAIAELNQQALAKSANFSACENASIVFITVESLTNFYFSAEEQRQLLPFFTELQQQGISSRHHISPSALTNNAMRILYAGAYLNEAPYSHMDYLNELGYQTCFLTSQKTSEFNLDKLLKTIGFKTTIDNYTLSKKHQQRIGDNKFFPHAFDLLTQEIDLHKPFFLQILNNQTHGPYFTYEKKILDRKERYIQAVKEADAQLKILISKIKEQVENLIVVYTSDHGESFGEEGYTSHANSVIQPQIQVPFVLSHPNLTQEEIRFSTHLDILPTLFDLIGHQYDYKVLGNSLLQPNLDDHCFAYCETRMGNTPTSFAIVTPKDKIYFDRQMKKYQIRDLFDHVLEDLTGEKYDYYLKLLMLTMEKRGLLF